MTLHSVRHDHHQDDGKTRTSAVMIPKLLQRYGLEIGGLGYAGIGAVTTLEAPGKK